MKYLIFYLQFHKKVTEVALCGVWFAVNGISPRFKIRREYKKRRRGSSVHKGNGRKRRTPRIMPTHVRGINALLCKKMLFWSKTALWNSVNSTFKFFALFSLVRLCWEQSRLYRRSEPCPLPFLRAGWYFSPWYSLFLRHRFAAPPLPRCARIRTHRRTL